MSESPSLFGARAEGHAPLAARMRPRTLAEYLGQDDLLGAGKPLRVAIERDAVGSLVLWGPPGTGKTTLAGLIAQATAHRFVPFSAVSEGVPRIREILEAARARTASDGARTLLFIDEIHRLNRGQQDALLPGVEHGVVTLIGATTENPSFELNAALLSRVRVVVLQPLPPEAMVALLQRALEDRERGLGAMAIRAAREVLLRLAHEADGDARRALTVLEAAASLAGVNGVLDASVLEGALQRRLPRHDKSGDAHFDLLSAYHKSLRGSDPQGALYWMARAIEAGEDPLVLFRRATAMAAEDIGLADPNALSLAVAAREAFRQLGAPEGYLPLAEMTIYLATAPKSNRTVVALEAARAAARASAGAPVPMHLRNAVTGLMRELGMGAGYQYPHDHPGAHVAQRYLPDQLGDMEFYAPGDMGFEKRIAERMAWWKGRGQAAR